MRHLVFLILPILFLTTGCKTSSLQADGTLVAQGNEPFWKVEISEQVIVFQLLSEEPIRYPGVKPVESGDRTVYVTTATINDEKSILRISLTKAPCRDSSVGERKPYQAEVERDGTTYLGCAK